MTGGMRLGLGRRLFDGVHDEHTLGLGFLGL